MIKATTYRYLIMLLCLLLTTHVLQAQDAVMQILDASNRKPVANVAVTNKRTKIVSRTDEQGHFTMSANNADTILCSHPGYNFTVQYLSSGKTTFYMYPRVHKLDEVEVTTEMAKFQRDSAERRGTYRKTILDSEFKPSIPKKQGIKVNGLVTALAYKISGKGKKNKAFVNTMVANEQAQYISIRYSPRLVTSLTALRGDSAQHFIDNHPMPYEFARNASDLEIKAWIREQYKLPLQKPVQADTATTK